jgi:SAM-dependent methyltransferase
MGWSSERAHEINLAFASFSTTCTLPVLDIGAGFGAASLAALKAGAQVIANDIDEEILKAFAARVDDDARDRLKLQVGSFPSGIAFPSGTVGAIHASNVLHFLHPSDLAIGIGCMFDWLVPGGQVFVMVNSTYGENFKEYAPLFLKRKLAGDPWPGWVEDLRAHCSHPSLQYIPNRLHLFDAETLSRSFTKVGFKIEAVTEFRRSYLPESLWNDGRENVMLIGGK